MFVVIIHSRDPNCCRSKICEDLQHPWPQAIMLLSLELHMASEKVKLCWKKGEETGGERKKGDCGDLLLLLSFELPS